MNRGQLFNYFLAFRRELDVSSSPIGFTRRARNQFSFDQPVDNVDRRVMSYLEALAQLRDE
jgi:hypothetical protein